MNRPNIIAEIGVNHENDINLAKRMISECKGLAWAVKFQYYKADLLASPFADSYWHENIKQNTYFKQYDLWGIDEYKELSYYTHSLGLQFIVTPFHLEAVDELEPYVDWYKIASSDITNLQLIRKVNSKNKPVSISTGGASEEEILKAKDNLNNPIMLHCILDYPAGNVDLEKIKQEYIKGYSDHAHFNLNILTTAWLLGAEYIEKHYTYDKTLPGNDHYHAMDRYDLLTWNTHIDRVLDLMQPNTNEGVNKLQARRSLFYKKDLLEGHVLTEDDLICLRPGTFIPADRIDSVIGLPLTQEVEKYSPVLSDDLGEIWEN